MNEHPQQSTVEARVVRVPDGSIAVEQLAVEEPLEIRINGEPLAVTMRTPGHDADLAAGFCFTEGIVDDPDDLVRVEPCNLADYGNIVDVIRTNTTPVTRREFYLSSSCGLCGTQTLDRIARRISNVPNDFNVSETVLTHLPHRMIEAQEVFARTGGLHAAALFTPAGHLRLLREDVGRHNAVDKVIGGLLLSGQVPCGSAVLIVSGRASFELVQKAARAGISFLAAVGAPSSLAVEAAERFGMTLVGFLREGRFNVYAHPHRISITLRS